MSVCWLDQGTSASAEPQWSDGGACARQQEQLSSPQVGEASSAAAVSPLPLTFVAAVIRDVCVHLLVSGCRLLGGESPHTASPLCRCSCLVCCCSWLFQEIFIKASAAFWYLPVLQTFLLLCESTSPCE